MFEGEETELDKTVIDEIEEPLLEIEFHKRIGHHFLHIFNDLDIPVTDIEEFIDIY